MARQKAHTVQLSVGDGGMPENFSPLGGMTLSRLHIEGRPYASPHLGDEGWRTLLASSGMRQAMIAGSGEFDDSAAETTLRQLALSGAVSRWRIDFGNGGMLTGFFAVTQYEYTADISSVLTYRLELQSAGACSSS